MRIQRQISLVYLLLDLPSLWYFVSENAFRDTEHVVLEGKNICYMNRNDCDIYDVDIPNLNENSIYLNYGVFKSLTSSQITSRILYVCELYYLDADGFNNVIEKLKAEEYRRHPNVESSFAEWNSYIYSDSD